MKVPCKDCLTLAICRQRVNYFKVALCPLIRKYINSKEMLENHPMYRAARVNKVRKQLGLKKMREANDTM